jgi:hypothetical protein
MLVVAARFWTLLRLVLQLKHDSNVVRWRLVACCQQSLLTAREMLRSLQPKLRGLVVAARYQEMLTLLKASLELAQRLAE